MTWFWSALVSFSPLKFLRNFILLLSIIAAFRWFLNFVYLVWEIFRLLLHFWWVTFLLFLNCTLLVLSYLILKIFCWTIAFYCWLLQSVHFFLINLLFYFLLVSISYCFHIHFLRITWWGLMKIVILIFHFGTLKWLNVF